MQAVIGAGAPAGSGLRALGVERVPLLRVAGETILARTSRCLVEGAGCDAVHILTPEEVELPAQPEVRRAHYTGAIVEDCLACLARDVTGDFFLYATGDIPLITPESIAMLVETGRASGADLVYPVVERHEMEKMFPGGRRTYAALRGGSYTGGNVFWVNRHWILDKEDLLCELFARRKDVLGLARLFGLGFILRVVLRIADLGYIERHVGGLLEGKLHAAPLACPELAADLDKVADLEFFRQHIDPWR